MKITVEFDDLYEFMTYLEGAIPPYDSEANKKEAPAAEAQPKKVPAAEVQQKKAPAAEAQPKKAPAAEVQQKKAPAAEAQQKEAPAAEAQPKEAPAMEVQQTEVSRVEVRKALALLNKKTGTNTASQLIHAIGFSRLTEVPQEMLGDLLEKAQEEMKNATT